MQFETDVFDKTSIEFGDNNYLHFLNIPSLTPAIVSCIDNNILSICEGNSTSDLATIKVRLKNYLESKRGSNLEMGSIAEFFAHLYLNEVGFTQEFMYLNLEDRSIKKGFDGYYTFSDEQWIFESKSGKFLTNEINHQKKVAEAYSDITNKVSGNVSNNPWQNAYNHASHIDVGTNQSIRQVLRKLKDDFTNGVFRTIGEFNIIPGSTIFLEDIFEDIDVPDLRLKIIELIENYEYKNIQIICINHATINLLWDYLEI